MYVTVPLCCRETTERMEGVLEGTAHIVSSLSTHSIVTLSTRLIREQLLLRPGVGVQDPGERCCTGMGIALPGPPVA